MQTINPRSSLQTKNYSVLDLLLRQLFKILTQKQYIRAKHTARLVNKKRSKFTKPKQTKKKKE